MPRKSNKDYLMYLDVDKLEMEISKRLRSATNEVKNLLQETLIRNASSLPMKDNEVPMADGSVTSDKERQESLVQSIKSGRVGTLDSVAEGFNRYWEGIVYGTYVTAMEDGFKDSHVGWYYEIGTGEESDPELYARYNMTASLGDVNPYRLPHIGAPIVSRSRNDGTWRDLGGNIRSTRSPVGGIGGNEIPKNSKGEPMATSKRYEEIKRKFRENIGEDIRSYEWYRKAVEEVSDQVLSIYTNSIRDLNILDPNLDILHVKTEYIVGEKWWRK